MMILVSAIYLIATVLLVIDRSFPVIPPEAQPYIEPALAALGVLLLVVSVSAARRQARHTVAVDERSAENNPEPVAISELRLELQKLKDLAAAAAPSDSTGRHSPAVQPAAQSYESAIVLLSLLQEKGRLIDFLMEPIDGVEDTQIAAVSRVVHQGCRQVLADWIKVAPIFGGTEGERTVLNRGYSPEQYRLIGEIKGEPPFNGTVVHRGWKIERITLPRDSRGKAGGPGSETIAAEPVITPAEFELQQ